MSTRGLHAAAGAVFACFLGLVVSSALGATRTYSSGRLRQAVPDAGTLESGIDVRDSGAVSHLAVFLRLDHERDSDLVLSLVAPDGTSVRLSSRHGVSGRNFGSGSRDCSGQPTVFEDQSDLRLSDSSPPFEGSHRPDQRLATLYGNNARGRWVLRVEDVEPGRTGTLFCWQLALSRDVVEVKRGASGRVRAELSYRERNFSYRDVRLRIVRRGRSVYSRPLPRVGGGGPYWRPIVEGRQPLVVRDLDADGEPEVVVDVFTGGAHCCTYSLAFRYSPARRSYRHQAVFWGNVGYRIVDHDRNGRPELSSFDDRFNYAFAAYAASVPPVRIWRYDRGRLLDVTRRFPGVVRADAARLWGLYLRTRRSSYREVRGILAAYLADAYVLGEQVEGWRRLELAYRRGDLGHGPTKEGYPAGRAYLTKLRAFLRETGYAG
jgi:subtilisin-like proprotein convertase family protein